MLLWELLTPLTTVREVLSKSTPCFAQTVRSPPFTAESLPVSSLISLKILSKLGGGGTG